jgi:glycosyltransferase involved in cell wall biosynthesis
VASVVNVLHATEWYFPDHVGGIEVYIAELARRQRAAGMRPIVVAPESGGEAVRAYEWEGTPVLRFPLAAAGAGFEECLRRVAPDVVHVHSLSTGIGIEQVASARRAAGRVIFTAHLPSLGFLCLRGTLHKWGTEVCDGHVDETVCAACTLQSRGVPRPLARAVTQVGRALGSASTLAPGRLRTALRMSHIVGENRERHERLLRDVDAFVALNRRALEIVRDNGAPLDKLVLNPLGVGFVAQPKPSPDVRPTRSPVAVGFIGRIHPTKGLHVLVEALRALPRDAALTIDVFGPDEGQDAEDLVGLLRRTASEDTRLRLRGPLTRERVVAQLRELDVLCCPSTWWENGPTIALEAQACGTPVIGTALGAMPEFIRDGVNGRVLPPGQWEPLRDALDEIARDPQMVDEWRRALPVPRSMDDVARDYERLYARTPLAA